jgi:hypothetical protein
MTHSDARWLSWWGTLIIMSKVSSHEPKQISRRVVSPKPLPHEVT